MNRLTPEREEEIKTYIKAGCYIPSDSECYLAECLSEIRFLRKENEELKRALEKAKT